MDRFKAAIFNNLSIFSKFYYGRIFNDPPNLLRLTLFLDLGNTHITNTHTYVYTLTIAKKTQTHENTNRSPDTKYLLASDFYPFRHRSFNYCLFYLETKCGAH